MSTIETIYNIINFSHNIQHINSFLCTNFNTNLQHLASTNRDNIILAINISMAFITNINKLVHWANELQMSFNVDKCSVMHIGHNNMKSNYNMSNQQLPITDQQRDLGIIITKDLKCKNKPRKTAIRPAEYWGLLPAISGTKTRTDPPIIQIPSPPTSRTCSSILVSTFKARH